MFLLLFLVLFLLLLWPLHRRLFVIVRRVLGEGQKRDRALTTHTNLGCMSTGNRSVRHTRAGDSRDQSVQANPQDASSPSSNGEHSGFTAPGVESTFRNVSPVTMLQSIFQ